MKHPLSDLAKYCALALCLVLTTALFGCASSAAAGRLPDNVTIGGVSVGGLDKAEALAALELELAGRAVTVTANGKTFELTAGELSASCDFAAALELAAAFGNSGDRAADKAAKARLKAGTQDFIVTAALDASKTQLALAPVAEAVYVPPVEAAGSIHLSPELKQDFTYTEGSPGVELDIPAMQLALAAALSSGASVEAVTKPAQPRFTVEFLQANSHKISTYTTSFATSETDEVTMNRVFNIQKAADVINCQCVLPGVEWSFNGTVGMRTLELGWKEAPGINKGKEYTQQAGGGICQVSTTLYNALLCGNITITDRYAHSIPSSYVPAGQDATVDSSGIDFKFRNDTSAPLYILAYTKPGEGDTMTITVSIYGEPLPEGVTYKPYSQIMDTIPNAEPVYVEDASIPAGYQLTVIPARDGYAAEVCLERFVNGKFDSTKYLHTDNYYGNPAEIHIGAGPDSLPVPQGAKRTDRR